MSLIVLRSSTNSHLGLAAAHWPQSQLRGRRSCSLKLVFSVINDTGEACGLGLGSGRRTELHWIRGWVVLTLFTLHTLSLFNPLAQSCSLQPFLQGTKHNDLISFDKKSLLFLFPLFFTSFWPHHYFPISHSFHQR